MMDLFVLLTPIIMLPVVALLAFVGCSFSIAAPPGLSAPQLSATAGDAQVTLTWPPDIEADKFRIYRGVSAGNHSFLRDVLAGSAVIDQTVANGTTYFYVATASVGQSETEKSNEVEVTPMGPASTAPVAFITGKTLGNTVSAAGWFGMSIEVGQRPLRISELGRAFAPGNSQVHLVQIIDAMGVGVPNAFASVDMNGGTIGNFVYGTLNQPVVLTPSTNYFVVAQEMAGSDLFYNHNTEIKAERPDLIIAAVINGSALGTPFPFSVDQPGKFSYGPVDFKYVIL